MRRIQQGLIVGLAALVLGHLGQVFGYPRMTGAARRLLTERVAGYGDQVKSPLHVVNSRGVGALPFRSILSIGENGTYGAGEASSPLHEAVSSSNLQAVEGLLASGAWVDGFDELGRTPLHIACFNCDMPITNVLVSNGATSSVKDKLGNTPLHATIQGWALGRNNSECGVMVSHLVALGTDVNAVDEERRTPLHQAATRGLAEGVRLLIALGGAVDLKTERGHTPLHESVAFNKDMGVVQAILEEGADVNAVDVHAHTPLHYAAMANSSDFANLLVEWGANPSTFDSGGTTALHHAATMGNTDTLAMLVDNGADPNAKDEWGRTPLHWLAISLFGTPEGVWVLVSSGANIHEKDDMGNTALHHAASHHSLDLISALLANGADANALSEALARPRDLLIASSGREYEIRKGLELLGA